MWINAIDCSKEACPPPCSLVKKCDELDTETDLDSIEVRAWDSVTCIPDENADEACTHGVGICLPAGYTAPVKSYIPLYKTFADVPDYYVGWVGDRAVIDDLYGGNQTWSLKSDPRAMTTEDMVTLSNSNPLNLEKDSENKQMKGIDFCKSVYVNSLEK